MMRTFLTCSLLLAFTTLPAWADPPDEAAAALEGTWQVQHAELSGQKFPVEISKTMSLTMKEGHYIARVGTQLDKGTYTIDADAQPATIDILGTEGPNKGQTLLGIYGVAGNTLTVCYDLSGEARPEEFNSLAGTQFFLVTYKRE